MFKCEICNKEVKGPCQWSSCKIMFDSKQMEFVPKVKKS